MTVLGIAFAAPAGEAPVDRRVRPVRGRAAGGAGDLPAAVLHPPGLALRGGRGGDRGPARAGTVRPRGDGADRQHDRRRRRHDHLPADGGARPGTRPLLERAALPRTGRHAGRGGLRRGPHGRAPPLGVPLSPGLAPPVERRRRSVAAPPVRMGGPPARRHRHPARGSAPRGRRGGRRGGRLPARDGGVPRSVRHRRAADPHRPAPSTECRRRGGRCRGAAPLAPVGRRGDGGLDVAPGCRADGALRARDERARVRPGRRGGRSGAPRRGPPWSGHRHPGLRRLPSDDPRRLQRWETAAPPRSRRSVRRSWVRPAWSWPGRWPKDRPAWP